MSSVNDRIEVALPSDENYLCGLLVTAASMAKYMPADVTLSINVLDGGIHDETFLSFANKVTGLHERTVFKRLRINEADFADFPSWSGNKMAYARLMLPKLLPDIDHVIYCDTDYIWLKDITSLWQQRDDACILQSVRDGCEETIIREQKWFEKHGLPFNYQTYFCTGLLFFNLRMMREERTLEQAFDFLTKHPDVQFADQTTMNSLLGGRVRLLSSIWQLFSRNVTNSDLKTGCAIHFAGEVPWRRMTSWVYALSDTVIIWHRFNASIYGISLWKSLRQWYGAWEIIRRRSLFLLVTMPIIRSLFFLLLNISGRGIYIRHFKTWYRPLKWRRFGFV